VKLRWRRGDAGMNPVTDISGLSALWQQASGGDPEIRIAVIDGPVDLNHSALRQARVTAGEQLLPPPPS